VGLLIVLTVVAGLYVKQAMAYLSVRSQSQQQQAIVRELERQNAGLAAQERSLKDPATVQREARALGMVRMGEHPYVITGLPKR
jgi:cell division protein FtsB